MKFLAKIFLLVLLVAVAAAGYLYYSLAKPFGTFSGEGVFVDVPRGASSRNVARLLQKSGARLG